jgi:uncharacterized protein (TIGR02217 family)
MGFIESPRFPAGFSLGAVGGPTWLTEVIEFAGGYEQRNAAWASPRHRYVVSFENRTQAEIEELLAFMRAAEGRKNGFRFRDAADYSCLSTAGRLGMGAVGTGLPTYQLYKRYTSGSNTTDRLIAKPVSGGVTVYRDASPVTIGAGAGQIGIDYTSGIVTFVADASSSVTAVTPGATTAVTLSAALGPLAVGEKLYLAGLTGTIASTLNNLAHTISNIATNTYTLSVTTTGLTWSGSGAGYAYPQAGESLTWAGSFDVPVRFDTDAMQAIAHRTSLGGSFSFDSIPLIEIRT